MHIRSLLIAVLALSCVHEPNVASKEAIPVLVNPLTRSFAGQEEEMITTIAFGSCNRQNLDQSYWKTILKNKPDLWIWGGDNVYADTEDSEVLKEIYDIQLNNPYYQEFLRQVPIIGIWDDHDYGNNDSGSDNRHRRASQQLFLDFVGEQKDSPRRSREGIYASYTFGPKGRQIKIFLLDTRYHKPQPNGRNDLLGHQQWQWLEGEIMGSQADLNIFVSGIQIVPTDHPFEKWAQYPTTRNRLFELIKKSKIKRPLILSGDRHIAELSQINYEGIFITELTSSGLTHSYRGFVSEPNRHRIGQVFSNLNFGLVQIDWKDDKKKVLLSVNDMNNQSVIQFTLP